MGVSAVPTRSPVVDVKLQSDSSPIKLLPRELSGPLQSGLMDAVFPAIIVFNSLTVPPLAMPPSLSVMVLLFRFNVLRLLLAMPTPPLPLMVLLVTVAVRFSIPRISIKIPAAEFLSTILLTTISSASAPRPIPQRTPLVLNMP